MNKWTYFQRFVSLLLTALLLLSACMMPSCGGGGGEDPTAGETAGVTDPADTSGNTGTTPDVTTSQEEETTDTPVEDDPILSLYELRTEDMIAPMGVDAKTPGFSWKMTSEIVGQKQTAYRIVVSRLSDSHTVWDSNKVESGDTVDILYAGEALTPSTAYKWDLTVWDKDGGEHKARSAFETGLFGTEGFKDASFISCTDSGLSSDTVYTIDYDFRLDRANMNFCFGLTDAGNYAMWQINASISGGRAVYFRPHLKEDGVYSTPEGDIDITAAIGMQGGQLRGKWMTMRIEVNEKVIKTYIAPVGENLKLIHTYNAPKTFPLGRIALRLHANGDERASYDNILIKDAKGGIIYENDFSSASHTFDATGGVVTLADGAIAGYGTGGGELLAIERQGFSGMPAFRKSFTPKGEIASAKLYCTGLGVYEAYINGARIGRKLADGSMEYHELKPGFTEMADRKLYSTYDVTGMLGTGEQVLSAVVTKGWWADTVAGNHGNESAFLCKLIITYKDGSQETIVTDEGWKTAPAAAVTMSDIFGGESYDARIDLSWMKPGYNDADWATAHINREFRGEITAWMGSYIQVREDLEREAESVTVYKGADGATGSAYGKIHVLATYDTPSFTLNPGETALIDFGQNFAGWEAFTVSGERGTVLTIEHGEMLNDGNGAKNRGCDGPEGSIYNANYRAAAAKTRYTLAGGAEESYHPSFSFYGFRYIEITTTETVVFSKISGQVVTSVDTDTGWIETSVEDLNQLFSNIVWGQYSNYLSVPTDCPQRDERQGWTADTQVFAEAGCYIGFSKSFLEKFLQDLRDSQNSEGAYPGTTPTGSYAGGNWGGTGWADAGVIVPYTLYLMYDDVTVIHDSWNSMQKYVDRYLSGFGSHGPQNIWGDWLAYESNDGQIQDILGAAYYAWDALMMAEMAKAAGYDDQVQKYLDLYEKQKAYFIKTFVREDGTLVRSEQTPALYALYLDLLPNEDSVAKVSEILIQNIERNGNCLQTGFLGTKIIMETLTKIGRTDMAYTLLLQTKNPSWLYSVHQGATTIWERWNSYTLETGFGDVNMNSFNHYAYGAVASWMFGTMAGIDYDPANPGFKHILVSPVPDARVAHVKASYDSAYGVIAAESVLTESEWSYKIAIPANTTATVTLPAACDAAGITVNGVAVDACEGVTFLGIEDGVARFEIVSGSFAFIVKQ